MSAARAPRTIRVLLTVIAWFSALTAVGGGVGLMINGLGLPVADLDGTMFSSYFIPGLLLALVVGGIQILTLGAQQRRMAIATPMHAAAGLTMMTWTFGEVAVLMQWSPLQAVYFALGLVQTALAVVAVTLLALMFAGATPATR